MTDNKLFTRESFINAMRREKLRKQEWEKSMNEKLDTLQQMMQAASDSHHYDMV